MEETNERHAFPAEWYKSLEQHRQHSKAQVKVKERLKPTRLTLDFNPQEFHAWQNIFWIYYRTSRMNTADREKQQEYFYSCISEHLQPVITRNTRTGATIFREEGQEDESCFDKLAREFNKKYPKSIRRYELFMMRQTMSFYPGGCGYCKHLRADTRRAAHHVDTGNIHGRRPEAGADQA